MHLEAEATLSKERYRRFTYWQFYRKDYSKKSILLVLVLASVVLWINFLSQKTADLTMLPLLGLMTFLVVYLATFPFWGAALNFRNLAQDTLTERYIFSDDTFEIMNESSERFQSQITIHYDGLHLAVEDGDAFYFFLDKARVFIVAKSDFTEGDPDELGRMLSENLGKKYVWGK
jgi:hypothetical protein